MRTFDALFRLFVDAPTLATEIGQKPWTVQKWRTRRRIPNEHWPSIIEAAKRRGVLITADDFLAMHAAPPVSQQRGAEPRAVGG